MKNKYLATSLSLSLFLLLSNPTSAFAQIDIGSIFFGGTLSGRTLGEFIPPLLTAAIVGAGVIAFLLTLIGGIGIIGSSGNPQELEKGKNTATNGVIGLVLVFSAYWILRIVEILTGLKLTSPGI